RVFQSTYDGAYTFVIGNGKSALSNPEGLPFRDATSDFSSSTVQADVSTDDWPFLYMGVRKYPRSYVAMVVVLLGVSFLMLRQILPVGRRNFSAASFFLGAGFMLVETRGITELGLSFGNTFQVISI